MQDFYFEIEQKEKKQEHGCLNGKLCRALHQCSQFPLVLVEVIVLK